ncbi:enoyl-CoA hydratase/isomerase family protein [Actinomadura darangshiensis]|uniref:Enoyl-CoA hydratase/isomerase family protein n=1 Tax=Actinomadura darangshiensis TaxID=705336 RepID=A0A4R5C3G5_9ACTN|nr:enoyl-CoA hydratase/isomerase family protein [Actinomadura darangshiensis]TDD92926.1 enoyl-CoA hydratase/isomerase family protein [Actinomadura darangshiensis]
MGIPIPRPDETGPVRVDRRGTSLHLVLDDEENRNRLSTRVLRTLRLALPAASGTVDEGVRLVVLESSSRRVFSAGADLSEMSTLTSPRDLEELTRALPALAEAMRRCPVPVLARVDGLCLAGGVGLVLAADIAVCADTAQFGLTEVDVGLWPFIVSALLMPHCSPKRAMDLMLSAEWIDAATACELGMVSRVVDADELDTEMERLIATISQKPATAVRLGKSAFHTMWSLPPDRALEYARQRLAASLGHAAVRRRIAAFQSTASGGSARARRSRAP